jgi:hypothetical protein
MRIQLRLECLHLVWKAEFVRLATIHVALSPRVVVATSIKRSTNRTWALPYRWVSNRRRCSPEGRQHRYRSWSLGLHKDAKDPESLSGITPPIPAPLEGRATTIRRHGSWRDALGAETARTHLTLSNLPPTTTVIKLFLLRPRPTLFGRFARPISWSGDGPRSMHHIPRSVRARNVTLILNTISALTYAHARQRWQESRPLPLRPASVREANGRIPSYRGYNRMS